jgi:aminoglycoside phosphotransferase (APT) family kinase protein
MAVEARTMEYARGHGFPVPAVHEVSEDGTELVMERIDGTTMLAVLGRQPWTIPGQGAVLAELHERLHEIPAPDWIGGAPCGKGDRLVHLDLHPLNVLVTKDGPVVIDWPNAARGDGNTDVALTWVLIAAGGIPGNRIKATAEGWGRSIMIRSVLKRFDRSAVRAQLAGVVEWKCRDPHMSESEREAMRRLV